MLWGVVLPCMSALIICSCYGILLIIDTMVFVPLAFFAWRTGVYIGHKIKDWQGKKAAFMHEIDGLSTSQGEQSRDGWR